MKNTDICEVDSVKKVRGISCLRKNLGLSGKEFAHMLDVSPATLSKWETGTYPIPESKKIKIAENYGCDSELLEKELNEVEEMQLSNDVINYKKKKLEADYVVENMAVIEQKNLADRESAALKYVFKFIENRFWSDPTSFNEITHIWKLMDERGGAEALNVALAAVEIYLTGKYKYLAVGESNYRRGLIKKDDPMVNIIVQALNLGLQKKEKEETEKSEVKQMSSESTIRRKLEKQGYRLSSRKDAYGVKMYTVIDSNNIIVGGEYTMTLEDVIDLQLKLTQV